MDTKKDQGGVPRPLLFLGDYYILRTKGCLFSICHNPLMVEEKGAVGSETYKILHRKKKRIRQNPTPIKKRIFKGHSHF